MIVEKTITNLSFVYQQVMTSFNPDTQLLCYQCGTMKPIIPGNYYAKVTVYCYTDDGKMDTVETVLCPDCRTPLGFDMSRYKKCNIVAHN